MNRRLQRFRRVAALGDRPTTARRLVAGLVAGASAFLIVQLLLGLWAGFDIAAASGAAIFASVALAVAAAAGAATTRIGLAIAYGLGAALWLLCEVIGAFIAAVVTTLGFVASALG